jgi:hypothetical protein
VGIEQNVYPIAFEAKKHFSCTLDTNKNTNVSYSDRQRCANAPLMMAQRANRQWSE